LVRGDLQIANSKIRLSVAKDLIYRLTVAQLVTLDV
jgi:hypothetical protein